MTPPNERPMPQPVLAQGDRVKFPDGSMGTVAENVFRGVAWVKVMHDGGDRAVLHVVDSLTKI